MVVNSGKQERFWKSLSEFKHVGYLSVFSFDENPSEKDVYSWVCP